MDSLSVVSRDRGLVGRSRVVSISLLGLRGVDRGTLIGDLSNKTVGVISSVFGSLDTAIRESNGERSGNIATSILGLSLLEVGLGVVISNSILIGIRLGRKFLNRGSIGRCMICRGTIGRGNNWLVGSGHREQGESKELVHVVGLV